MREIIFRGKRIDNGEWAYGYVSQAIPETYETYIMPQEIYNAYEVNEKTEWTLRFEKYYEVDPLTVGQYTGLKDKNGVKIYEGDILYHHIQGKRKVYYPFNERVASYGLENLENGMCSTLQDSHAIYEIVGNIHDNKELI